MCIPSASTVIFRRKDSVESLLSGFHRNVDLGEKEFQAVLTRVLMCRLNISLTKKPAPLNTTLDNIIDINVFSWVLLSERRVTECISDKKKHFSPPTANAWIEITEYDVLLFSRKVVHLYTCICLSEKNEWKSQVPTKKGRHVVTPRNKHSIPPH